jgi:RNA polymerase sigma factor (sigma-70 family)
MPAQPMYACRVLRFPPTHRSAVERIQSGDPIIRQGAFAEIVEGYWRPAYFYLRLQWRLDAEDAEDALQGFFATAFEKGYLERFDASKARFRTFLRTCLDRFVQNQRKAARRIKRGGAFRLESLDFPSAERDIARVSADAAAADRDEFFRTETIRALFGRTIESMRDAYAGEGRAVVFAVFERHDLDGPGERSYASVAEALGLTVSQVTNHLHAARRRFRDLAIQSLRSMTASDEEFRAEARELFGIEIEP